MPDNNTASMRDDLIRVMFDTYGAVPAKADEVLLFRTQNKRIFASLDGKRLDVACGHLAGKEMLKPYLRPCVSRPDTWASVDLDGPVRFNIILDIVDVSYKFVTSHDPMGVREETAASEYRRISGRIHATLGAPTTYSDTPLDDSEEKDTGVPERIKQMRNLLSAGDLQTFSEAYIFICQARFMEDYEDDYVYTGKRGSLFQAYRMMGDQQLRGYFGWRTAYRAGKKPKYSPEYPFIYVCELINGIGWKDPEDGFRMLMDFLKEMPPEIFPHRSVWTADFCAVYGLEGKVPLLGKDERSSHTLECPSDSTPEDALATAIHLSDYKIGMSKIMRGNEQDVAEVIVRLFRILRDRMDAGPRSLLDMGFVRTEIAYYRMFPTALFYDQGRAKYEFTIRGVVHYRCSGTTWNKITYRPSMAAPHWFGDLIRTVDSYLRPRLGVKGAIKPGVLPGTVEDVSVRQAVDEWMAIKNYVPPPVVEVDASALEGIRRDADDVRDRILTEEERAEPSAPVTASAAYAAPADDDEEATVGPMESQFLRLLLAGEPYDEFLKSGRKSVDVMADTINEAFFDRFGDIVIDMSSGLPEIIDDYRDELEEILNG